MLLWVKFLFLFFLNFLIGLWWLKKKTSHSLPSVKLRFSKGVRSSIMAIPITWRLSSVVNFHTFDFSSNRHDFFSVFKRNSAFEIGKIQFFVVSSVFFRSTENLRNSQILLQQVIWLVQYFNITVLTTIVSGFISTCGNVFSCSCRPWF